MADCSTFDTLVVDWLYDELDPAEAARITRHVDGCAACWQTAESLVQVRALFRAMPEEEPPGAISARVLREAAAHAASRQGRGLGQLVSAWITGAFGRAWAHPAAAAVASLVLVAGVAGALFARGRLEMAAPRIESAAVHRDGDVRGEVGAIAGVTGGSESRAVVSAPEVVQPSEMAEAGLGDEASRDRARPSGTRAQLSEGKRGVEQARRAPPARPEPRTDRELERGLAARAGDAEEQAALLAQDVAGEALLERPADRDGEGYRGGSGAAGNETVVPAPAAAAPRQKAAETSAGLDESEPAPPATETADARLRTESWAESQHAELRAALRDQQCTRALGIASDIQAREPGYYRSQLAGSKELAACRVTGRKAVNRASKPQERTKRAADTAKSAGSTSAE
jgi:hypothetical protein